MATKNFQAWSSALLALSLSTSLQACDDVDALVKKDGSQDSAVDAGSDSSFDSGSDAANDVGPDGAIPDGGVRTPCATNPNREIAFLGAIDRQSPIQTVARNGTFYTLAQATPYATDHSDPLVFRFGADTARDGVVQFRASYVGYDQPARVSLVHTDDNSVFLLAPKEISPTHLTCAYDVTSVAPNVFDFRDRCTSVSMPQELVDEPATRDFVNTPFESSARPGIGALHVLRADTVGENRSVTSHEVTRSSVAPFLKLEIDANRNADHMAAYFRGRSNLTSLGLATNALVSATKGGSVSLFEGLGGNFDDIIRTESSCPANSRLVAWDADSSGDRLVVALRCTARPGIDLFPENSDSVFVEVRTLGQETIQAGGWGIASNVGDYSVGGSVIASTKLAVAINGTHVAAAWPTVNLDTGRTRIAFLQTRIEDVGENYVRAQQFLVQHEPAFSLPGQNVEFLAPAAFDLTIADNTTVVSFVAIDRVTDESNQSQDVGTLVLARLPQSICSAQSGELPCQSSADCTAGLPSGTAAAECHQNYCICGAGTFVQPNGRCGTSPPACGSSGSTCRASRTSEFGTMGATVTCAASDGFIPSNEEAHASCGGNPGANYCCYDDQACRGGQAIQNCYVRGTDAAYTPLCVNGFVTCLPGDSPELRI